MYVGLKKQFIKQVTDEASFRLIQITRRSSS